MKFFLIAGLALSMQMFSTSAKAWDDIWDTARGDENQSTNWNGEKAKEQSKKASEDKNEEFLCGLNKISTTKKVYGKPIRLNLDASISTNKEYAIVGCSKLNPGADCHSEVKTAKGFNEYLSSAVATPITIVTKSVSELRAESCAILQVCSNRADSNTNFVHIEQRWQFNKCAELLD